ncbi:MAG: penicillin-binding protein 1C [Planctomycetota bacterium]
MSLSGSLRRVGWWCLVSAAGLAVVGLCALLAAWVGIDLPEQMLTDPPDSPRVTDAKGRAILTLVGPDDQWRLDVPISRMSPWLAKAAVATEDERFYLHEGIDPIAAVRAISQNALLQYRFSGASTITMQTCRLKDPNRRTWRTKIVESIRALKLEQHWPKGRILEAWLNLAPMGGNVQGVEAAAWQYFGKSAAQLSLGESALLVGLAQSPSRYRPDRHLDRALGRQRVVLKRMLTEGYITQTQYQQAVDQPIQLRRTPNLRGAPHAAWMALSRRSGGGQICLDLDIQDIAYTQIARGLESLPDRTQAAAVIIDIESAGLVAMVGSPSWADPDSGQVNFAAAWRSPGSALKPFVYAAAMQAGRLRPDSTVYDVPIVRGAWQPENFDRVFRGEVSAAQALRDSLNIPAILVAEAVGIERCTGLMRACGIQLPDNAAARGQLAAVTGAVEVRLLELTNGYATLGRGGVHRPWRLFVDDQAQPTEALVSDVAAAINRMLSLTERTELAQPDGPWCMWKTGTSSGRRDAWAVGHNGRYAIGVWVGADSGPGRSEYVGAAAAEPIFLSLARHPALAGEKPPAGQPIVVRRPIGPPADSGRGPLRMLRPEDGARFIALDGQTVIHPLANRSSGIQWFLNGRLISPDQADRLVLPTGVHELRLVDATGASDSAVLTVTTEELD